MSGSLKLLAPPLAALAVLAAMLATNASGPLGRAPEADAYFERVKSTIDGVPSQLGVWLGIDAVPTPAAVDLLQPNRILQRRFTNPDTGEWFELLIVHCKNVRDMNGHYPPVCYPAHGWSLESQQRIPVPVGDSSGEATDYLFSRGDTFAGSSIRIANMFMLPGAAQEPGLPDYSDVERASRYQHRARLGSVQIQVITPASMPAERRQEILRVAARLVGPVLSDVERGPM